MEQELFNPDSKPDNNDKRKRNILLVILGLVLVIAICCFCSFAWFFFSPADFDDNSILPGNSQTLPGIQNPQTTTIEYYTRITSCDTVDIFFNDGIERSTRATRVDNPWSHEFEAQSGQELVMIVECVSDELFFEEVVTCVIRGEDGEIMFQQESGKNPVAVCLTTAP
jgi:flagellar basal body-associated protein FliL